MARGVASPAPNALPRVSFVKVSDEVNQKNPGVHDNVAKTYGYNDGSEFQRPEHYIRYIEPLETDLAVQVEYDMDEQDQEWLDALNAERKAHQLDKVSYETFEIVMDRLEKEWFDLTKNIPKSDMALPSEDSTCAICDDSEGENTNAIVFCDGCNLAVHQDCYGVPYIPEGQWLCRKCTVSPENPVSCILCPNEGGAFKQTVSGEWVHLLCAIWIPETSVANDVFMEPITGVDKISKQRWRLRCSVCDIKYGACVQCTKPSCFTAFHATCARKEKLLMPMKATQGSEAPTLACYCEKHLPHEQYELRAAMRRDQQSNTMDGDGAHPHAKSNKTMRAYNKQYKPGPPLVPRIVVNRILQYIHKIHIRHKQEFVHLVCKYWSLKREARRGAPLLKRLHLEPWTALSGSKQQTDEEKAMKLDHLKRIQQDLMRLRSIADIVRKRERTKRDQADAIQNVLLHFFFPHEGFLRLAFENITSLDRQEYFKSPVSKAEVPDYYDIIKHPMCWDMIDQKLDRHEYLDLSEFKHDVNLVLENAMTYNQVNTPFYKTAVRIQAAANTELAKLDRLMHHPSVTELSDHPDLPPEPRVGEKIEPGTTPHPTTPEPSLPRIGDLEPPLDLLNLLVSEELIRSDTNIIVTNTPIDSLLSYELPLLRPPAPPPPPPTSSQEKSQKPQRRKPKFDRKTMLERKKQERKMALDASPGFRAPRTRAGRAAAVAFETEANGAPQTVEAEEPVAGPSSVADVASAPGKVEKPPRRPRKSAAAATGLQMAPAVVDDVDSRQSFKMFEVGWILPADHRRGGRAPVERQPPPPPRKRTKSSHGKARVSDPGPGMTTGPAEEDPIPASVSAGDVLSTSGTSEPVAPPVASPSRASEPPSSSTAQDQVFVPEAPPSDAIAPGPIVNQTDTIPQPVFESTCESIHSFAASPILPHSDGVAMTEPTAMQGIDATDSVHSGEHELTLDTCQKAALSRQPSVAPGPSSDPELLAHVEEPPAVETQAIPMDVDEAPSSAVETREADVTAQERRDGGTAPVQALHMDVSEQDLDLPNAEDTEKGVGSTSLDAVRHDPVVTSGMDAEQSSTAGSASRPEQDSGPQPEPSAEEEEEEARRPIKIIYIDKLDTPATRREENRKKKAEREARRLAAQGQARGRADEGEGEGEEQPMPVAGPSRLPAGEDAMDFDSDSDLTALTEFDSEEEDDYPPAPKAKSQPSSVESRRQSGPQAEPSEPGAIVLGPGEKLEGGTLVWAKLESFPWWPAVVFEEDDAEVPKSVLSKARAPGDSSVALVRFYEKKQNANWAWVKLKNMRYLGEDDALDAQMLAPSSKYQRWRNIYRRTECRNAYQDALAEMEAEGEAVLMQAHAAEEGSAPTSMEADSPMTEME